MDTPPTVPLHFRSAPNKHNAYLTLIIFSVNNMMILLKIWETGRRLVMTEAGPV